MLRKEDAKKKEQKREGEKRENQEQKKSALKEEHSSEKGWKKAGFAFFIYLGFAILFYLIAEEQIRIDLI